MRTGENPIDILCNLPTKATAGSFFVTDPLGRSPLGFVAVGQSAFYEVNLYSGALQRRANIPAGLVWGAGTCACYDADRARIWVVGPGTGVAGDFAYTGYYNTATNNWFATGAGGELEALASIVATWGTDGALVHLAVSMSRTTYTGDELLLRGSGLRRMYRYDAAGDAWTEGADAGVVASTGCSLAPLWGWNPRSVIAVNGNSVPIPLLWDVPTAGWPMWMTAPTFPEPMTTGSSCVMHPDGRRILYRVNATGQIIIYDPILNTIRTYAHIYGADGTAAVGGKLCAFKQNGDTYLAALLHDSTTIQRIRIVE
jgi:hypothetical protein